MKRIEPKNKGIELPEHLKSQGDSESKEKIIIIKGEEMSKVIENEKNTTLSAFAPISIDELIEILGLTIKKDEVNKVITFLCELSAYTEDSQFNISYNAPSSTGKSYIPTQIARLFPEEDVEEVGYCSPTSFFHEAVLLDEKNNVYSVDYSRKILIFLDQPHNLLLQYLRPFLSHDKKIIELKITDKKKGKLETKIILLKGFPSVIFCTAGLKINQQEATRFLLLSPQTDVEKLREAIILKIKKESDKDTFKSWLEENSKRKLLKERIQAIKDARIKDVKIVNIEKIKQEFNSRYKIPKPRHQRDIGRIISLIKSLALLNLWHRDKDGDIIIANDDDIDNAFLIWEQISEAQELEIPPYIYDLYGEVIVPLWKEKKEEGLEDHPEGIGLTRQEICKRHLELYGRSLADWLLRQEILPMLDNAGLINLEKHPTDKRKTLIHPPGEI